MIRLDRLARLAEHLESGQLGHDEFNFGCYHKTRPCGTLGCAIGECPFVWADDWMFDGDGGPVLAEGPVSELGSGMVWFGIDDSAYRHLFVPECQQSRYGGVKLTVTATRYEVAANIRAFIDTMGDTPEGEGRVL